MTDEVQPPTEFRSRVVHLLLACAIAGAFVGFFIGLNRKPDVTGFAAHPDAKPRPAGLAGIQPAISYTELRSTPIGPNRNWTSNLDTLIQDQPDLFDAVQLDPAAKSQSLVRRESRRAYNGAPPVIPHTVDQLSATACMACHEHGLRVENRIAGSMPHPYLTNCTQCHVEQQTSAPVANAMVHNAFDGKAAPFAGERAWPGAPPVIPHTTHMRNDCLACHGLNGPAGMQTSHPWRQSCTQCHASSATLNQQPGDRVQFLSFPDDQAAAE